MQLQRYGFAGDDHEVCEPTRVSAQGLRVAYDWDTTLQEWWVNDARGLEHGYTVHRRPADCAIGLLTFTLAVRGDLIPTVQGDGRGVRFSNVDGASVLTYAGLTVTDADGQTLPARFDSTSGELHLSIDESGARYPLTVDPIVQQIYVKASNTEANDLFGNSVSVSGDTLVVGAYAEDSNATGINGNEADNSASSSGAVYVFVRSGTSWSQQAYIKSSGTAPNANFGGVSIDGDTLVVGANGENNYFGAVYVFIRSGTTWSQQAYLTASNPGQDLFGTSVAVSGDVLVVGAPYEASNATGVNGNQNNNSFQYSGAAYVFARNGTTWTQQAYLKASNTGVGAMGPVGDEFGGAVAVSGNTVVVGARYEESNATGVNGNQADNSARNSGAAYVFERNGTVWTQQAYLKASNTEMGDQFGASVSCSGDTVVVGAAFESSNAPGVNGNQANNGAFKAGAAYVFVRSGGNWSQQAYVKASNPTAQDEFGTSLTTEGDTLVVGANQEDGDFLSTMSSPNEGATNSGAVYVFKRTGTTWIQTDYLKASNAQSGDLFGYSCAVSGTTIAVGASGESSNATGINGHQSDNSASRSGAAYVFMRFAEPTAFCFGDGSGTACPCSTVSATGRGCSNSVSQDGALLTASGAPSVSLDSFVLRARFTTPFGPCLFVQGSTAVQAGVAFGDGLLCLSGNVVRIQLRFADATGSVSSATAIHAVGASAPNDVRSYQAWYRDAGGVCPGSGFNLTNALTATWQP